MQWKLLETALIAENGDHGVVYKVGTLIGDAPGSECPFTGEPGPHMEPMDEGARIKSLRAREKAEADGREWISPGSIMNKLSIGKTKTKEDQMLDRMASIIEMLAARPRAGRPPRGDELEGAA